MLKIRRPLGRLIFNMGIAIPGKTVFLIETAPWFTKNTPYHYVHSICFSLLQSELNMNSKWNQINAESLCLNPNKVLEIGRLKYLMLFYVLSNSSCEPWTSNKLWFQCFALQRLHNEHDGVSNNQPHDCLLNHLFSSRSKKTSKLRATGLWVGNSSVTSEFPAQRASYAENVSIWWRHHGVPGHGISLWGPLTHKHLETNGCVFITVAAGAKRTRSSISRLLVKHSLCWTSFIQNVTLTMRNMNE